MASKSFAATEADVLWANSRPAASLVDEAMEPQIGSSRGERGSNSRTLRIPSIIDIDDCKERAEVCPIPWDSGETK